MKKIFLMCTLMVSIFTISANAQWGQGGDTTGRAQRMKEMREKQKAGLIEQAKLSGDEADKVLDLQTKYMMGMRSMRDLTPDDRKKKMDEMEAAIEKDYKAIPLTDEKVKAVKDYMATQRQRGGGRGPGGQTPPPAQAPPQK